MVPLAGPNRQQHFPCVRKVGLRNCGVNSIFLPMNITRDCPKVHFHCNNIIFMFKWSQSNSKEIPDAFGDRACISYRYSRTLWRKVQLIGFLTRLHHFSASVAHLVLYGSSLCGSWTTYLHWGPQLKAKHQLSIACMCVIEFLSFRR